MVPANCWGYGQFTDYQLKIIQEIITLVILVGFCLARPWRKTPLALRGQPIFMALAAYFAFAFNKPTTSAIGSSPGPNFRLFLPYSALAELRYAHTVRITF